MIRKIQVYVNKYGGYLEELRRRIMVLVKIFAVVFVIGFFLTIPGLRLLLSNVEFQNVNIVTTSPFQLIDLAMSTGFLVGSVAIVPLFVYHLYAFLKPGLSRKERLIFVLNLPFAFFLFAIGFAYGAGTMYYAVQTVATLNASLGVGNYWDIATFASQMILTSSLLGLLFLSPIGITIVIRSGLLNIETLSKKRRHVIAGTFIFVALLPPTDGLSMVLMALPLIVIFELTILWNRGFSRKYLLE